LKRRRKGVARRQNSERKKSPGSNLGLSPVRGEKSNPSGEKKGKVEDLYVKKKEIEEENFLSLENRAISRGGPPAALGKELSWGLPACG